MADFRLSGVRQTPWACGHNGAVWYACVHAEIEDALVIETAKCIVDKAAPQRLSTFHGAHHYSFFTREYLLNLLLDHYQDYGVFPSGSVCVVEKWLWDCQVVKTARGWSKWLVWKGVGNRSNPKPPAHWLHIPSVESVLVNTATLSTGLQ